MAKPELQLHISGLDGIVQECDAIFDLVEVGILTKEEATEQIATSVKCLLKIYINR